MDQRESPNISTQYIRELVKKSRHGTPQEQAAAKKELVEIRFSKRYRYFLFGLLMLLGDAFMWGLVYVSLVVAHTPQFPYFYFIVAMGGFFTAMALIINYGFLIIKGWRQA